MQVLSVVQSSPDIMASNAINQGTPAESSNPTQTGSAGANNNPTSSRIHYAEMQHDLTKEDNHREKQILGTDISVNFSVDKDTGSMVIKFSDKISGKVIKQIPPKELLDAISELWKVSGIKVDRRA